MKTKRESITVSGIPVEIHRKNIKNIYLSVRPPAGHVRISAPARASNDSIRQVIVSRLDWIRQCQHKLRNQPVQVNPEYVAGERHYYHGKPYLLDVVEKPGRPSVKLMDDATMLLTVAPGSSVEKKQQVMDNWYRNQLKKTIPTLIEKWQPVINKQVNSWGIKKMKTRWGSCNITDARIWINLELAKNSPECLEFVFVHEMVHLHERYHNANFRRLMDQYLPQWRMREALLKSESHAPEYRVY